MGCDGMDNTKTYITLFNFHCGLGKGDAKQHKHEKNSKVKFDKKSYQVKNSTNNILQQLF